MEVLSNALPEVRLALRCWATLETAVTFPRFWAAFEAAGTRSPSYEYDVSDSTTIHVMFLFVILHVSVERFHSYT